MEIKVMLKSTSSEVGQFFDQFSNVRWYEKLDNRTWLFVLRSSEEKCHKLKECLTVKDAINILLTE